MFRQIATSKDDRLTAAQLLAVIDRELGAPAGGEAAPGAVAGYAPLERWQVRLATLAGTTQRREAADGSRGDAIVGVSGAGLVPLARTVMVGAQLAWTNRDLDANAALVLRAPILADAAAIELTGTVGWNLHGVDGLTTGLRIGAWVAWTPRWAIHLDVGGAAHALDADAEYALTMTAGVSWLIER